MKICLGEMDEGRLPKLEIVLCTVTFYVRIFLEKFGIAPDNDDVLNNTICDHKLTLKSCHMLLKKCFRLQ